jgi:hypothetical protein
MCVPEVVWNPSPVRGVKDLWHTLISRRSPFRERPNFLGFPLTPPPLVPLAAAAHGATATGAAASVGCDGPLDRDPPCRPRTSSIKHQQTDCAEAKWKVYLGYCRRPGPTSFSDTPVYVGITSRTIEARRGEHRAAGGCFAQPTTGRMTYLIPPGRPVQYLLAKGVEQALLEHYGFKSPGWTQATRKKQTTTAQKMPFVNGHNLQGQLENTSHSFSPRHRWYLGVVALGEATLISRDRPLLAFPTYGFFFCGTCDPRGRGAR